MKNVFLLAALFSAFVISGCEVDQVSKSPEVAQPAPAQTEPKQEPAPAPELKPEAPAKLAQGFAIEFKVDPKYATAKETELLNKAFVKVKETVQSQCFKDFMVKRKMISTNGRSSAEVYEHITNLKAVVPVKMYYRKWGDCIGCTSAVAYRQPPQKTINLNRSFFTEKRTICRWAATVGHEAMGHSVGEYGHTSNWNKTRDFSVPYSIGGSVEKNGGSAFSNCCIE